MSSSEGYLSLHRCPYQDVPTDYKTEITSADPHNSVNQAKNPCVSRIMLAFLSNFIFSQVLLKNSISIIPSEMLAPGRGQWPTLCLTRVYHFIFVYDRKMTSHLRFSHESITNTKLPSLLPTTIKTEKIYEVTVFSHSTFGIPGLIPGL